MAEEKGKEEPKGKDKGKDSSEEISVKDPNKNKKIIMAAAIGGGILLLILLVIIIVLLLKPSPATPSTDENKNKESISKAEDPPEEHQQEQSSEPESSEKESNNTAGGKNAPPIFLAIEPSFTVNISGGNRLRMMQIKVQLMAKSQKAIDAATTNMPLIQNALVSLFSSKSYDDLITPEGKESLRTESLKVVQEIIKNSTGQKGIDEVLFTSFVMQ